MSKPLSEQQKQLYRATDETLHYLWDPIGIAGIPQARDEYCAYLPQVYDLLLRGSTAEEIAAYLVAVESERMGLAAQPERAHAIASVLVDWRGSIDDKSAPEFSTGA